MHPIFVNFFILVLLYFIEFISILCPTSQDMTALHISTLHLRNVAVSNGRSKIVMLKISHFNQLKFPFHSHGFGIAFVVVILDVVLLVVVRDVVLLVVVLDVVLLAVVRVVVLLVVVGDVVLLVVV